MLKLWCCLEQAFLKWLSKKMHSENKDKETGVELWKEQEDAEYGEEKE